MLPLRLELKNFLPYIAPDPIHLEGIHLACLTGQNGAGKSSLLDAITWALWGRARARTEGELVHLGQQEMYVQLDFEQEGIIYRVVRRRRGGKKGTGSLDIFVVKPDSSLVTLNEPSLQATQNKIDRLLRLSYNTFIHSAFLQQGKADAFTTSTPAERKRILGEILGLETWAMYEERTKDKLKTIDNELASIEGAIRMIEDELRKEPQYQRDREAARAAYEEAQKILEAAEKRLEEVAFASTELRNKQEQLAGHEQSKRDLLADEKAAGAEITARQENISRYEAVVAQSETIEAGYTALQHAREVDSTLGAKLSQMSDLDGRITALEKDLDRQKAVLEKEKSGYEATIIEVERLLENDGTEELVAVELQIAELEKLEAERDALYEQISQFKAERSGLEATRKALHAEGKNLNERIEKLESAEGAECPLCGQPLTEDHRQTILGQLTGERDTKRAEYGLANQRLRTIEADTATFERQMETLAEEIKRLPALRSRAGALEKQLEDARAAQSRREEAQARLKAVSETLATENFALELREQLTGLRQERANIGYDRETHESARDSLKQYQDYEKRHTELEIARNALPGEHAALDNACARQERIQNAILKEDAALADLTGEIEKLKLLVEEQRRREEEVRKQRTFTQAANQRLIVAEQQLNALAAQRERKTTLEIRRENTRKDRAVYDELKLAFGKNGVPAMMIETAIPELEAAANDLLARMTNGRMHLRMTTQREKVTGGVSETLDIEIADDLGTRAYEMYSGGEAFRIDFAIRIALSKMLARRAGAHLRTLFIDEGFGTQDDDGRTKLVEAINAIQSEFDLILVITHLDDLRDSFPGHIIVEKTPHGSMVSVR